MKYARTVRAEVSRRTHVRDLPHGVLQWENAEPLLGDALSVTLVPLFRRAVQRVGQWIPAGREATLP